MVGRFSSSFLLFCPRFRPSYLCAITSFFCAASCFSISVTTSHSLMKLIIICTIYGYFIGLGNSLRSLIFVENFGIENLTNSYGLCSLALGIGGLIGPMTAGAMADAGGDICWAFIYGVCAFSVSFVAMVLAPSIRRWEYDKKGPP